MGSYGETRTLRLAILGSRGYPSTYGGYETFVRRIAPAWAAEGHHVTVYCRERSGGARVWDAGDVRCVWTPGKESKSLSTLTFGLTAQLDAIRRSYDAALIVNVANGLFMPLLRARGLPTVVNTDGLEWTRGKWGPTARRVFYEGARMSSRFADVLVSDSVAIADQWQLEFGVRPRFIPYGADVLEDSSDDLVRGFGIEPHRYVLVVARLAPENNVELILDALERHPELRGIVVGSANYDAPIEARLRALDRNGRVRWLGHVHDQAFLNQLWANAGVYVHGHSVGGTNPALLQALGAGAPTLALNTPYNREVLQIDEQLFANDPEQLGHLLSATMSSDTTRRVWAMRGKDIVRDRYSWDGVIASYTSAVQAAIDRRK